MKNNLKFPLVLLVFILFFSSCNSYPPDQKQFMKKVNEFRDNYKNFNGNDVAQELECKNLDSYVSGFVCSNWVGKIIKVNSFLGFRWIEVKADKITFKIWPQNDSKWEELGNDVLNKLKPGKKIVFSGEIISEMSLTCSGKMDEPELKIEPKSIQ
jgi:hypothetical protein